MHPKYLAASISIHAAREGGDPVRPVQVFVHAAFQSTPPVKAATRCGLKKRGKADISIHAAREGGDEVISDKIAEANISIHAAREGGDVSPPRDCSRLAEISIHAAREGGDCIRRNRIHGDRISIHAAREGGDAINERFIILIPYFNPRRP